MTVRVGIIGCGRVAEHHLTHIRRSGRAELVGVVDIDTVRARELAGTIPVFDSLEALVAEARPDIVHIVTPPATHHALALAALNHGVHVFVEKPLGLTVAQVDEMYDAAERNGLILCPDFINLYHPLVRRALDQVARGVLGEIKRVEVRYFIDAPSSGIRDFPPGHWLFGLPGGILQNNTCHPLYLALALTGPSKTAAIVHRSNGNLGEGVTDQLEITIDGQRCIGSVSIGIVGEQPGYTFRIEGARGWASMDFTGQVLTTQRVGRLPGAIQRLTGSLSIARQLVGGVADLVVGVASGRLKPYPGLGPLLGELYDAMLTGGSPPIPRALARETARLSDEIFSRGGLLCPREPSPPRPTTRKDDRELVLVTGATGYLGGEIVRVLKDAGYRVRALARPQSRIRRLLDLDVEVMFGDVRDEAAVERACAGAKLIVHAAAALSGSREAIISTDVQGTRNVAEAAQKAGAARIVYVGSVSAYDVEANSPGSVVHSNGVLERTPEQRGGASEGKRLAETLALEEVGRAGSKWTILRPGLIFGAGRSPLAMLGSRVGRSIVYFGKASGPTRFVHCTDVATAILAALRTDAAMGQVFNIVHPDRLTASEALAVMSSRNRLLPIPMPIMSIVALCANMAFRALGSAQRLGPKRLRYIYWHVWLADDGFGALTGWRPAKPLREQLAAAVDATSSKILSGSDEIKSIWSDQVPHTLV